MDCDGLRGRLRRGRSDGCLSPLSARGFRHTCDAPPHIGRNLCQLAVCAGQCKRWFDALMEWDGAHFSRKSLPVRADPGTCGDVMLGQLFENMQNELGRQMIPRLCRIRRRGKKTVGQTNNELHEVVRRQRVVQNAVERRATDYHIGGVAGLSWDSVLLWVARRGVHSSADTRTPSHPHLPVAPMTHTVASVKQKENDKGGSERGSARKRY